MRFNQGDRVMTVDGKEAGHIERVVIDPRTNEITHLVVRRGLLQNRIRWCR
jgi:sporulation protein YlmC with PRC-barrel domain